MTDQLSSDASAVAGAVATVATDLAPMFGGGAASTVGEVAAGAQVAQAMLPPMVAMLEQLLAMFKVHVASTTP